MRVCAVYGYVPFLSLRQPKILLADFDPISSQRLLSFDGYRPRTIGKYLVHRSQVEGCQIYYALDVYLVYFNKHSSEVTQYRRCVS